MRRSFRLLTIFGIPVEINYTWFIIFGLVTFTLARGYFPTTCPDLAAAVHWIMGIIASLLLFVSLLLHELSHSVVAIRHKLPISSITLFIFGGVAHMEKEPDDPSTEFKMAIAGPLCSFGLALIFYVLTQTLHNLNFPCPYVAVCNYLFILNLVIGIFNLVPAFPLDGGRVFRAGLWGAIKDLRRATRIASGMGKGFAYLLMGLGFVYLFTGYILQGVWFIFIGLFLHQAAETSYQQLVMRKALIGVKVKDIMARKVITVDSSITLDKLVEDYFFKHRHASFPVMSGEDILGLVTIHDVKKAPREKWSIIPVTEVMTPMRPDLTLPPDTEIVDALTRMAKGGIGRLLVMEEDKLVGILAQRDILRLFELETELKKPE